MIDEAPLSMSDQSAFKAWSCANRYSCQLCDYITAMRHAFGGHLNIRHKTNIPNYELTFGKFKVKRHQCLLCGRLVIHDKKLLVAHFLATTVDTRWKNTSWRRSEQNRLS